MRIIANKLPRGQLVRPRRASPVSPLPRLAGHTLFAFPRTAHGYTRERTIVLEERQSAAAAVARERRRVEFPTARKSYGDEARKGVGSTRGMLVTQRMRLGERRDVGVDGVGAGGGRGGEGGELALTPTASRPSWPARRRRRPSRSGSAPCRPCTRRRRPASARGRGREVSLGSIPSPTRSRRVGRAARPRAERERERDSPSSRRRTGRATPGR